MSPSPLVVSDAVAAALESGRPVVALESTIISHGFPRPQNLAAARRFEQVLVDRGVTPATIAVVDGVPRIGLDEDGLTRIAEDPAVIKVSGRDLAVAMVQGITGATTVAATALLAARAGIRVFSSGCLAGVPRRAAASFH
jgi:pseudouridine-5'-phosphate glycosidase